MIAITQHHRVDIPLPPIVEEARIVVLRFALCPDIEWLVEHEQTESITSIKKCRGRRIMCRADGIEARCLQQLNPSLLGPIEGRGAKRPIVVMNTAASELDGCAVQAADLFRQTMRASGHRTESQPGR